MAKITPKENFMKLVNGGHPEYVPYYTMMGEPYLGEAAETFCNPPIFNDTSFQGGTDMWGVPYKAASSGIDAMMPDTGFHLFEDIEDWSKAVKFPQAPAVNELDWNALYENSIKMFNIDRTQTALKCGPILGPFQELVAMMGFENGLAALYTDPEECLAMFMAMCDYLEPYYTRIIDEFKPDLWYMLDDTCAQEVPFFSPEIYEQVFLPVYKRLAKPANDRGIPIIFHNCGKVEEFCDFMLDFGVSILEPTQLSNDLLMLKDKYKNKMSFIGGWDWNKVRPLDYPNFNEEELRQTVRDSIDKYAPGGAYGIIVWPISYPGDPVCEQIKWILRDECHWYGRKAYGYTGDDE